MLRKIEKFSELEDIFNEALKEHAQTVAVELTIPGQRDTEFIVNRYRSIRNKLNYYKRTYSEDLIHNKVPSIKIVSAGWGDAGQRYYHQGSKRNREGGPSACGGDASGRLYDKEVPPVLYRKQDDSNYR